MDETIIKYYNIIMISFFEYIQREHIYKIGFSFIVAKSVDKLFNSIYDRITLKQKETIWSNFINLLVLLIIGYILQV